MLVQHQEEVNIASFSLWKKLYNSATDIDELRIQRLRQNNERLGLGLDISSVDWTNGMLLRILI